MLGFRKKIIGKKCESIKQQTEEHSKRQHLESSASLSCETTKDRVYYDASRFVEGALQRQYDNRHKKEQKTCNKTIYENNLIKIGQEKQKQLPLYAMEQQDLETRLQALNRMEEKIQKVEAALDEMEDRKGRLEAVIQRLSRLEAKKNPLNQIKKKKTNLEKAIAGRKRRLDFLQEQQKIEKKKLTE